MKKIIDHLENEFNSIKDMCNYYNISYSTFKSRRKRGWSLEKCLIKRKEITDHLNNKFKSIEEMCDYHKIHRTTFEYRRKNGLPLKECLMNQRMYSKKINDHLGNEFNSISEMCKNYDISYITFNSRKKKGLSLESCLAKPKNSSSKVDKCTDHLGNVFRSTTEMCNYYQISTAVFYYRQKIGLSLKECLLNKKYTRKK